MAQDHQQEMFSYLNGTYGANDYSPYGQLGFSKYEADQRKAAPSYSSFTSTSPSTSASTSSSTSSWFDTSSTSTNAPSYPTTTYTGGGSYSSSTSNSDGFEEFISLSDWLFDPIEEFVPDEVVAGIVIIFAVVGAVFFPMSAGEVNWVTILIGGVIGGIAAPVAYLGLRAAVSLLVVGLVLGFWLAVGAVGFYILAAILN